jgi:hypothetical protein
MEVVMALIRNPFAFVISFLLIVIPAFVAYPDASVDPIASEKTAPLDLKVSVITDIKVYELGVNLRELRSDWAKTAQDHIEKISAEEFKNKKIELKLASIPRESEEEWEDIKALYSEFSNVMFMITRYPKIFPEGKEKMVYRVGSIENIMKGSGSNYLVYINGVDFISTAGRIASKVTLTALAALVGVIAIPKGETTYLNIAVMDPSGRVVWHGFKASSGGYDLRDYGSAQKLIREIMDGLDPRVLTNSSGAGVQTQTDSK